jgi:hypothetical protein
MNTSDCLPAGTRPRAPDFIGSKENHMTWKHIMTWMKSRWSKARADVKKLVRS